MMNIALYIAIDNKFVANLWDIYSRFYNCPYPNNDGYLIWKFTYFPVLTSPVHVQSYISMCWRFGQTSGYFCIVLVGCHYCLAVYLSRQSQSTYSQKTIVL